VRARAGLAAALAAAVTVAWAGDAPPPRLKNAQLEVRSAAAGLAGAVRAAGKGPVWLAYEVPTDGGHSLCCWDSMESIGRTRAPGCRLDGHNVTYSDHLQEGTVSLEGDRRAAVYLRVERGRVDRLRALSRSCGVDAGGLPVHWLPDVAPADSAAFLSGLLDDPERERRLLDEVLMALSVHADPAALGHMIRAGRRHPSSRVRSQALFWLAQKAGRKATETIERAVAEDPESQVRQQAVFALSQLPRDQGVPRLIDLARSHRDPNVREKAMFWLGQSEDPRALAFFEQILTH
jgi:hypothetical protein